MTLPHRKCLVNAISGLGFTHVENQMDKETWTKLWWVPFDGEAARIRLDRFCIHSSCQIAGKTEAKERRSRLVGLYHQPSDWGA
jgi:hypothetical protein